MKIKHWKHRKIATAKRAVIRVDYMPHQAVCDTCDNVTLHYKIKGVRGMVCTKQISGLRLAGHRVEYV